MPWKEMTLMSERKEFINLAQQGEVSFSELCLRFGIHRDTGYKWLHRFESGGENALMDRSRRPLSSPVKTSEAMEQQILQVRDDHPQWGGRKIRRHLGDQGWRGLPAPSTITGILQRNDRLHPVREKVSRDWQTFEASEPNELWQMDFKGHFPSSEGRCHPLTILDDHSRYSLAIRACAAENGDTVRSILTRIFRRYGMPRRLLMDNGSPWGSREEPMALSVWLMRLNIALSHGRPKHPQTQGKLERFHRTLKAEVIASCTGRPLNECQRRMSDWRHVYNFRRPHEALSLDVPATRYRPSALGFQESLPAVEYGAEDIVRKVQAEGWFSFRNRDYRVSRAFRGEAIALRPAEQDGLLSIYYCRFKIGQINLAEPR